MLRNRGYSAYRDWFYIDFGGTSGFSGSDNLWYEGWEGHYELVKLNLNNKEVVDYLLETVKQWHDCWHIDGLRLDVAYSLQPEFLKRLRELCDTFSPDFFLIGEILHGDYNRIMNSQMLHSVTNYQLHKGMWSSYNDMNMFEVAYTLEQHFGKEFGAYRDKRPLNFVDNHDVERAASILKNPAHLPLLYALMFAVPGVPCVYYGSEWGCAGYKRDGDNALRPCFSNPVWNGLSDFIAVLSRIHKDEKALQYGDFRKVLLTNRQFIFERRYGGERILIAINADEQPFLAHFHADAESAAELISGKLHCFSGGSWLEGWSVCYWKV